MDRIGRYLIAFLAGLIAGIAIGLIVSIDDLKKRNQELTKQNLALKQRYTEAERHHKEILRALETANKQVIELGGLPYSTPGGPGRLTDSPYKPSVFFFVALP